LSIIFSVSYTTSDYIHRIQLSLIAL